ncbi:MAG: hypothetical protein RSE50_08160 [Myroides sp.]
MKKLIMITALLMCFVGSAQKKKPKKIVPPPPVKEVPPPPKIEELPFEDDKKKCFVFKAEEQKDSLTYVTETLLEYGWNNDLARMIITTYDFDPVKKKEAEEDGYILVQSETMQFINGTYKIEKDVFTFTPEKSENFKKQLLKINYKDKTKKVDFLRDENNNKLQTGECLQPMVSM